MYSQQLNIDYNVSCHIECTLAVSTKLTVSVKMLKSFKTRIIATFLIGQLRPQIYMQYDTGLVDHGFASLFSVASHWRVSLSQSYPNH